MRFSLELIENALKSSNKTLLDVITDTLGKKINEKERVSKDYLVNLAKEKKIGRDMTAENLYKGVRIDQNTELPVLALRLEIIYLI